jgi:outer membrane immunogenic protein
MRLIHSALLACVACAVAVPAIAADLSRAPITKAPALAPVVAYNWSGFYIGGHVGGTWGNKDWTDVTVPAVPFNLGSQDISGIIAGGQVASTGRLATSCSASKVRPPGPMPMAITRA